MPYKRKTWQEKLEDQKNMPKIVPLEVNFPCRRPLEKMGAEIGDSVVLAAPSDVNAIMQSIPKGQLTTLGQICERLATKHGAQYCCTLTTGIFVTIAANAAEEMNSDVPYWRTIKNNGELNPKYPGGAEQQKVLLEKEGHTILPKGKKHIRYAVKDFERFLVER
ncbi:MAG: MGMT family protein [Candidatus Hermodarchaeota archaeon]